MNTFLSALAVICFNCYFWLNDKGLSEIYLEFGNKNLGLWKDSAIVVLMLILLLDSLLKNSLKKKQLSEQLASVEKLKQDLQQSETENNDLKAQLNSEKLSSEKRLGESREQFKKVETALAEAQSRLSLSQTASITTRPESIDAELVNLLSTFQEKGRLIDFLMEDISRVPEAQVAAAARVVHQGCSSVLKEYFSISPIHSGKEGEPIEIDAHSPAGTYQLVGKIAGTPPYKGVVLHRGWETETIRLPRLVEEEQSSLRRKIIAPTQVEVR